MEGRKWEELDRDCLIQIFQRLGLQDLTLGVPFICRSWFKASVNPACWRVLNFHELELQNPGRRFGFLEMFKREYRRDDHVSLTDFLKFVVDRSRGSAATLIFPCNIFSVEDLIYVSDRCLTLRVLTLHDVRGGKEKHLPDLISKWKDLEHLTIGPVPPNFCEIVAEIGRHCKSFIGLSTTGWMGSAEVCNVVVHLPTLKELRMKESLVFNEHLLLVLEGCRELEVLEVRDCWVDADGRILELASRIKTFECESFRREKEVYAGKDEDYEDDEEDVWNDHSHIYGLYNSDASGEY